MPCMTSAMNESALLLTLALHRPDDADDHESEDCDRGEGMKHGEGKHYIRHDLTPLFVPDSTAIAGTAIAVPITALTSNMGIIFPDFNYKLMPTRSRIHAVAS